MKSKKTSSSKPATKNIPVEIKKPSKTYAKPLPQSKIKNRGEC